MGRFTKAQLHEDVDFLVDRANEAGSVTFSSGRSVGLSSNALVRFAYTGEHDGVWPSDTYDYAACVRAVANLPDHRRTRRVMDKLREAERNTRYPRGEK